MQLYLVHLGKSILLKTWFTDVYHCTTAWKGQEGGNVDSADKKTSCRFGRGRGRPQNLV